MEQNAKNMNNIANLHKDVKCKLILFHTRLMFHQFPLLFFKKINTQKKTAKKNDAKKSAFFQNCIEAQLRLLMERRLDDGLVLWRSSRCHVSMWENRGSTIRTESYIWKSGPPKDWQVAKSLDDVGFLLFFLRVVSRWFNSMGRTGEKVVFLIIFFVFCEDWFLKSLKIFCRSFSLPVFHFTPLDIFGCQFSQPSRDVCSKIPSAGSEDTQFGDI